MKVSLLNIFEKRHINKMISQTPHTSLIDNRKQDSTQSVPFPKNVTNVNCTKRSVLWMTGIPVTGIPQGCPS